MKRKSRKAALAPPVKAKAVKTGPQKAVKVKKTSARLPVKNKKALKSAEPVKKAVSTAVKRPVKKSSLPVKKTAVKVKTAPKTGLPAALPRRKVLNLRPAPASRVKSPAPAVKRKKSAVKPPVAVKGKHSLSLIKKSASVKPVKINKAAAARPVKAVAPKTSPSKRLKVKVAVKASGKLKKAPPALKAESPKQPAKTDKVKNIRKVKDKRQETAALGSVRPKTKVSSAPAKVKKVKKAVKKAEAASAGPVKMKIELSEKTASLVPEETAALMPEREAPQKEQFPPDTADIPETAAEALLPEESREIFKAVKEIFRNETLEEKVLLPAGYGDNKIVLLVRDPYCVFAYWEISPGKIREIKNVYGARVFEDSRLVLRVRDLSAEGKGSFFDISIPPFTSRWYINISDPGRSYMVEIGLQRGADFIILARSNAVDTPPDRITESFDEEWYVSKEEFVKILTLSGVLRYEATSPGERESLVKEFMREYIYGMVPGEGSHSFLKEKK